MATPSTHQHLSDLQLQRRVNHPRGSTIHQTDPELDTEDEDIGHCEECMARAQTHRQLYWQFRARDDIHTQHQSQDVETLLTRWLGGMLSASEAEQARALVTSCSVCRSLAEEAGEDLRMLKGTLTPEGETFLTDRARVWDEALAEEQRFLEGSRQLAGVPVSAVPASELPTSEAPVSGQKGSPGAEPTRGQNPQASQTPGTPSKPTMSRWEWLMLGWLDLRASLRWTLQGGAVVMAAVLVVVIVQNRPQADLPFEGTAMQTLPSTDPLQAKGAEQPMMVSIEGDLLMASPQGTREVVAQLSSKERPEASAPNTAELRLRASLVGRGYLSLWQVTEQEAARLYEWPLERYNLTKEPLLDRAGERLGITLKGEQGKHTFVLILSEAPVPAQAGASWITQMREGKLKSVAFAAVTWDIRTF